MKPFPPPQLSVKRPIPAGHTLLCLAPNGESFLAAPCLGRGISREQRLLNGTTVSSQSGPVRSGRSEFMKS